MVGGWRAEEAVLYFATSEALLMTLGVMTGQPGTELAEHVRSGDVVVDLARPVRLWARYLAESYGNATYYAAARTTVLYVAACALYGLAPPLDARLLWLPLSLFLAVGIAALTLYVSSAAAYWTEYAHGPIRFVMFSGFLFGGIVVPLDFYPEAFRAVCDVLPFRGSIYTPIALATGKLAGAELAFGLGHQVFWFLTLAVLAHTLEARGTRRLAALGG